MTDVAEEDPYLARGFAPLRQEFDCPDLAIEGALPPELLGTYYRVGPNPQFAPRPPYNPLMGDGMVHAFRIAHGRVGYRNRWVRTGRWVRENAAGRALFATAGPFGDDPEAGPRPPDGVANTSLVWHAGRLLALEEGAPPVAIDPVTLETLGPYTFGGALPRNMTAHPKTDPATGALVLFANLPRGRLTGELALHEADAAGVLSAARMVQGPHASIVHDFAITPNFAVFVVCPVTLSLERARAGGPLIAWEPQAGVEALVVPRAGGEPLRFATAPCMVWHVMNAFEDGGRIVLDLCEQDVAMFPTVDGAAPDAGRAAQRLARWDLDPGRPGGVTRRRLHDFVCEYPRIDERRTGRPYRYGYVAGLGGPGTGDLFQRGLARFDHATGEMAVWDAGPGVAVSEPVFAPRGPEEGDGWLLANTYDEASEAGSLVVLDASDVAAGPVARARLTHRMPMGFHGLWIPQP
ncbi:carotenoid oxygenase family protein [Phenylobacterium sp.]|uniref:carotenoid oxygenase family protein n=1 Tax=Phenylobacterium sp. TaxID=1871053 RepID=UPI0025DD38D8|nr:carotenoid oxygenase family protein [Phenylobacterium sp.]MBX3486083.1 carotenoid oxygenase family protein [Phenylobacterium sp.]